MRCVWRASENLYKYSRSGHLWMFFSLNRFSTKRLVGVLIFPAAHTAIQLANASGVVASGIPTGQSFSYTIGLVNYLWVDMLNSSFIFRSPSLWQMLDMQCWKFKHTTSASFFNIFIFFWMSFATIMLFLVCDGDVQFDKHPKPSESTHASRCCLYSSNT